MTASRPAFAAKQGRSAGTQGQSRGLSRRGLLARVGAALVAVALPHRAGRRVSDGWVLRAGDR